MGLQNAITVLVAAVLITYTEAGMDEFLRNSVYTIQSKKDDGALSLTTTPRNTYNGVTIEKWNNSENQKWIVRDFQSLGLYEFTPLLHNTTSNVVTYQFTKNVYSYKRQWKVIILSHQRYQIKNPESGLCLSNMGTHEQVEETDCDITHPMKQIWKFRLLGK